MNTVAPNCFASWIAARPMPLVPPWISTFSPRREAAAIEEVVPDGEVVLGQARRLEQREPRGIGRQKPAGVVQYSA